MLDVSKLFEIEIEPALGCTEPTAIGYATSLAYNAILGRVPKWLVGKIPIKYITDIQAKDIEISSIEITLDRGMFKNATAIKIPKSGGQKGIDIAAAMGVFCFPEGEREEMALFKTLQSEDLEVKELAGKVKAKLVEGWETSKDIDIKAVIAAKHKQLPTRGIKGIAKIEKAHSNVVLIDIYDSLGKVKELPFEMKPKVEKRGFTVKDSLKRMKISEIVNAVEMLPEDAIKKMMEMMEMNIAVSEKGLQEGIKGLGIGTTLRDLVNEGYLGDDLITSAQIMAASAADTRMGGFDYQVMICAGSGNQGITASLPIVAVAQKNGYDVKRLLEEKRSGQMSDEDEKRLSKLVKALALSNLITCYVTYHTKYLSALCGCAVKAGIGAAAGVAYFLSGSSDKVEMAIQNMAGNITGLICDGAKEGCSLKLATAASAAIQSALLATKGIRVPSDNGIVAQKVEDTIRNLGRLCQAMITTDAEVVRIMKDKT